jgi:hypothetical protein
MSEQLIQDSTEINLRFAFGCLQPVQHNDKRRGVQLQHSSPFFLGNDSYVVRIRRSDIKCRGENRNGPSYYFLVLNLFLEDFA